MIASAAQARSLLCMCLSGVGDALTFTPFIRVLKQHRPDIQIDVLVMFRACESLYQSHPSVRTVHFVDFVKQGGFASLRDVVRIRRTGYDAVAAALPANRWEYNVIQVLLGGRRIGHRYKHCDRGNLNFLKHDWLWEDESAHVVNQNLNLLRFFDVPMPTEQIPLHFPLPADDQAAATDWLGRIAGPARPMIAFHPGSATFKNHIMKRWPADRFAVLAQRIVDEWDAHVLVFGTPDEQDIKSLIVEQANRPGRVHSVDGTSLRVSAALIARCGMMVSNDSALMHVSAAIGTPVVAIFGYTNARTLYPWAVPHVIVRKDLPCSPCFFYSPKPAFCHAGLDYQCIKGITVDDVFNAAAGLRDATGRRAAG